MCLIKHCFLIVLSVNWHAKQAPNICAQLTFVPSERVVSKTCSTVEQFDYWMISSPLCFLSHATYNIVFFKTQVHSLKRPSTKHSQKWYKPRGKLFFSGLLWGEGKCRKKCYGLSATEVIGIFNYVNIVTYGDKIRRPSRRTALTLMSANHLTLLYLN